MSGFTNDTRRIAGHFDGLLETHGLSPKALDWGSPETQLSRFDALASGFDLSGASVLDIGCGLGDFWRYLNVETSRIRYTGIDIAPKMIAAARERFPGVDFRVCDILEHDPGAKFDYVFASGIFYLRSHAPMQFVEAMAKRMFDLANRGAAFNFLSNMASEQAPGEFFADPAEVLRTALLVTPNVALRHDYLPHDFTVFLHRGRD